MTRPLSAGRRLYVAAALLLSVSCFGWMLLHTGGPAFIRDRWWRHDLAERFPAGESSQALLLVNDGTVPAFAEVRCAGWSEPRLELLLPGQSQMIAMPADAAQPAEVRMRTLDLQARDAAHVVQLPEGWIKTFIDVDEDGEITSRSRPGGDSSPKRGFVGVDSAYALPVRVEVPFDAHERPSGEDFERKAWIGPGVRWDSAQCAYAMDRVPSVSLWVPRASDFVREFEIAAADSATRLTMQPDGTVVRDAIPAWRRLAAVASF